MVTEAQLPVFPAATSSCTTNLSTVKAYTSQSSLFFIIYFHKSYKVLNESLFALFRCSVDGWFVDAGSIDLHLAWHPNGNIISR